MKLIHIYQKGMLIIPFGMEEQQVTINLPIAGLAIFIALLVIIISIKSPAKVRSYALLIGIILGWIVYTVIFGVDSSFAGEAAPFQLFPFGSLTWDTGVVLTAVMAGLLYTCNTFGALNGSDDLVQKSTTIMDY